jgi:hypothetical protein
MNNKHYNNILIKNNIIPKNDSEKEIALKLITQKEKFILEDAVNALIYNKTIPPKDNKYALKQYIDEINKITNQYYFMYIQISQFEAFLRTYINHTMIKVYGDKWHQHFIMQDLTEFQTKVMQQIEKPSKALNSISFGTLELVYLNGSRFGNVFQSKLHATDILAKDGKPKYHNKGLVKGLFSIVRNARNDICHHRRIGESIKSNPKYHKKKMSRSDVIKSLTDLKILLGYDDQFDVKSVHLEYKKF